jgi:ubiquinone/menaquinone biosynthesis C-methylase UbiE
VSGGSGSTPVSDRDHYSYRHYADRHVAEGFDALRFSGPIGRLLLDEQRAILADAFAPLTGRVIVDVGSGTGRAALGLAAGGATVLATDASAEMLQVARSRAAEAGLSMRFGLADAHALPLPDRSVDAAVCLRVLMHALDWRQCVAELCRVSRWRVVTDYPSATSLSAIESLARRLWQKTGRPVEAYRVLANRDVARVFASHGFRIVQIRRQFVLPTRFHKTVNHAGFTRGVEGGLAAVGLLRLFGSPVTIVAER